MREKNRILIVDDDQSIGEFLSEMFADDGYVTTTVYNGASAMTRLENEEYQLVLLDLRLPDMHGTEILQKLRIQYPDIDVIIITSYASIDTVVNALRLGAVDYLFKPFDDLEFVMRVVNRTFEQRRTREENKQLVRDLQQRTVELEEAVKRLTSVNEVSKAMHSILNIDELVSFFAQLVAVQLGARRVSIMLIDRQTGEMKIDASIGLDADLIHSVRVRVGEGIAGWVAEHGEAVLVNDIEQDDRFNKNNDRDDYETNSFISAPLVLSVPIKYQEQTLGVINVNNKIDNGLFTDDDLKFITTLSNQAAITIENIRIFDELKETHFDAISALAEALEAKDVTTGRHSSRLEKYAMLVGERLGLDEEQVRYLRYSAVLHDIGKIGVSENILQKPGKLTMEEYAEIKQHPVIGADIVKGIRFLNPVAPIISSHHEWYDGRGYPDRLSGESIPMESRILAVLDAYDAMTSDRQYRKALGREKAVSELNEFAGTQFDPRVVKEFLAVIDEIDESKAQQDQQDQQAGNKDTSGIKDQFDLLRS